MSLFVMFYLLGEDKPGKGKAGFGEGDVRANRGDPLTISGQTGCRAQEEEGGGSVSRSAVPLQ